MDGFSEPDQRKFINNFLKEFKVLMYEGRYIVMGNHVKNLEALGKIGIDEKQRDKEVLSLSVENYYAGPKDDQYRKNCTYWEFGKTINGHEVYIKLEIVPWRDGGENSIVLSFHIAERPMKYPLG